MQNPRTSRAGITRAVQISLGGGTVQSIPGAGSPFKLAVAAALDRAADVLVSQGRHNEAERLAHQAADLRAETPR